VDKDKKSINYNRLNQLYNLGRSKLIKGLLNEGESQKKKEEEEFQ
jgi:hypothetical protein